MTLDTLTASEAAGLGSDDFMSFGRNARARVTEEAMEKANLLLERAFSGDPRARLDVREAFSTSDFTMAAFATIEKTVRTKYQEFKPVWQKYCSQITVKDFRKEYILDSIRGKVGLDPVVELGEYPTVTSEMTDWSIQVKKWGDRFAASWEAWINDRAIDEIADWPNIFVKMAMETDALVAVGNLVSAAGVNTDFFKSANGNAPDNKPLTTANLEAAITALKVKVTAEGRPIDTSKLMLVYPPALDLTAKRILTAKEISVVDGSTTTTYDNYLTGSVTPVEDPMLAFVNKHAKAATTWFLLPEPNSERKAIYLAKLRGHESPDIRWKADAGQRNGGGSLSPQDGSFEVDDIQVRVRHIAGGGTADPAATYVSLGS